MEGQREVKKKKRVPPEGFRFLRTEKKNKVIRGSRHRRGKVSWFQKKKKNEQTSGTRETHSTLTRNGTKGMKESEKLLGISTFFISERRLRGSAAKERAIRAKKKEKSGECVSAFLGTIEGGVKKVVDICVK